MQSHGNPLEILCSDFQELVKVYEFKYSSHNEDDNI